MNESEKTFYVVYDLSIRPPQYDFLCFMAQARTVARGYNVHVIFKPREDGGYVLKGKQGYTDAEALYRLEHILFPACIIYGATFTVLPYRDAALPPGNYLNGVDHKISSLVDIWETAGDLFRPQATARSSQLVASYVEQFKKPIVTITLRDTWRYETKNSNTEAWFEFAHTIEHEFQPVFVPDTGKAFDAWDQPFPSFPAAAIDLDTRLALYEQADMNCFTFNGPGNMCWWSNVPLLFFLHADDTYWSQEQFAAARHPVGEQPPYFKERQKIVWGLDELPAIKKAFAEMYA